MKLIINLILIIFIVYQFFPRNDATIINSYDEKIKEFKKEFKKDQVFINNKKYILIGANIDINNSCYIKVIKRDYIPKKLFKEKPFSLMDKNKQKIKLLFCNANFVKIIK